jgi:hypothetical protein
MPFRIYRDADTGIAILSPSGEAWVSEARNAYRAVAELGSSSRTGAMIIDVGTTDHLPSAQDVAELAALHAANGPVAGRRVAFVGALDAGFRVARKLALEVLAEGGRAFAFSAVEPAIEWLRAADMSRGLA